MSDRSQVLVRFPPELLERFDRLWDSGRAFDHRNDAIVGVIAAWCRAVEEPRGRKVRAAAAQTRDAWICPDERCVPPRRNFGDPNWTCPEHGKAVRQPNNLKRADVESKLGD
jgi:hypothetical protein